MTNTPLSLTLSSIGVFRGPKKHRNEAPRQAYQDTSQQIGCVELLKEYQQGLKGLEGFTRIWLIYVFHHNIRQNTKLQVQIPRGGTAGVFATRAPYRPNPIGLSCVCVEKIEGNKIFVREFDLLDNTPILDIKPYLPSADLFTNVCTGWVEATESSRHLVRFSELALAQLDFLEKLGIENLKTFLIDQLEFCPTAKKRKRVKPITQDLWQIAYRTWRANFSLTADQEVCQEVNIHKICSGYTPDELTSLVDTYGDIKIHQAFVSEFTIKLTIPTQAARKTVDEG